MSFLDVLITRTSNGFKTFSEVYSNFNSFISQECKVGLIFTLLFRKFSIVFNFSRFHSEIYHLKEKKERIFYQIEKQLHQKLSQ